MIKVQVNEFKNLLKEDLRSLEDEYGHKEDDGYAFAQWCADLIKRNDPHLEPDAEEALTSGGSDLKADIVFDDSDRKYGVIAQCKFRSLKSLKLIDETEVNDFFQRHKHFMDRHWIKENGSERAIDLLIDYKDKIEGGYHFDYFFITTTRIPDDPKRINGLIEKINASYQEEGINIECKLYDFHALKEYHVHSLSLAESTPDEVEIELQKDIFFERDKPYPSIIASIKGNALIDLYKRYKNSIFTYNIRNYLGDRNINQTIKETAENKPGDFFYFNNGISAICTNFEFDGDKIKVRGFQIINGAQTVGALWRAGYQEDLRVLFRLTTTKSVKTESGINSEIIRFNNTQNSIKISDFKSNEPIQKWLESRFKNEKRHALLGSYIYKRKRSFEKAPRGKTGIGLEEFGKIRYAFLYEPTLVSDSPRQLWANKEGGGSYEKAFGVDGEIIDAWSDQTFIDSLVAILCYKKIENAVKIVSRKTSYTQLGRLKYFILRMMYVFLEEEIGRSKFEKLLDDEKFFNKTWEEFWKTAKPSIFLEYEKAQDAGTTTYALARNEQNFKKFINRFKVGLSSEF